MKKSISEKKRVLFVSNDAGIEGGSPRSLIDLALALQESFGYEIVFLLPSRGALLDELEKHGFKCRAIRYCNWTFPVDKRRFSVKNFIKMCITFLAVPRVILWTSKQDIDIIHSANSAVFIGGLVSFFTGMPHVWHIREFLIEDHGYDFICRRFSIFLLNKANKLICVSKAVRNKYAKILDSEKLVVVYNGFRIPSEESVRSVGDVPPVSFNILMAGTITHTKGQREAIKAIRILSQRGISNYTLSLAGSGDDVELLKEYVNEHQLTKSVIFLGFVPNLDEIRKDFDIALVCSRNEAFGRVTIEAMLYKNLIVGANTAGTLELVKDGVTGILYHQGSAIDLADKLEWCMSHWMECCEIVANAREHAMTNYSIKKCAHDVSMIYKNILPS